MKKNIVNWGIISTAKIGWEHVIPAIQKSKNSKVLGLASRDLKKAKLVQRGEQLILSAGSQNYSIETIAVALQDGYFGDQIRLRNLASNQEVRAVVWGINRAKALR